MHGIEVSRQKVQQEWIDFNGHMNVAYYVLAFDLAIDSLWERFGMTKTYREETSQSTFAVESHVRYLSELSLGDPIVITAQVVDVNERGLQQFQRMYHAGTGVLCATCEWLNLHVSLVTRRVVPWPADILAAIRSFQAELPGSELPEGLCPSIRLR